MGLINCGLGPEIEPDNPFLLLMDPVADGVRETFGNFQFELRGVSGLFSRSFEIADIEAMRCSLAFLDALVSRANRGRDDCCRDGAFLGCACCGTSDFWGADWLMLNLFLKDRGAPRPLGCLTNLFSVVADVGKSSKEANSVPSP